MTTIPNKIGLGLIVVYWTAMGSLIAYGVVAQLVRAPACHAGSRGFESHQSRWQPANKPLQYT